MYTYWYKYYPNKRILTTLKKYDAKATFFLVANRIPKYPDVVKQAYNQGCQIAGGVGGLGIAGGLQQIELTDTGVGQHQKCSRAGAKKAVIHTHAHTDQCGKHQKYK